KNNMSFFQRIIQFLIIVIMTISVEKIRSEMMKGKIMRCWYGRILFTDDLVGDFLYRVSGVDWIIGGSDVVAS
ncbi:hypothetical protein, partial [Siminovitchia fortis]|uniref:hypothetical protein n=1 Tax=Siminovitchia fortis TaxID=254758 RepID=UPI001C92E9A9